MNKINFYVLSILFLFSSSCLAQYYSGRHDSLLFDGANENFQKTDEPCLMKVVTVNGNVIGMAMTKLKVVNCLGEVIGSAIEPRKRVLNVGDMVVAGEPISTGAFEGSFVILQLHDRENLIFGGKTGLIGVRDYCRFPPDIVMELEAGKLGFDWNPLLPHKVTISTAVGELTITGTKLSLETVKDGDITTTILKVYEGSVNFGQSEKNSDNIRKANEKRIQEINAEQAKLNVDYQNGKISVDEFTKKSKALGLELVERSHPIKEITVNAGFESRIIGTDKPTDPVPIDANEKPWWEDLK